MSKITIETEVLSVQVTAGGYRSVTVEIEDLETDDILGQVLDATDVSEIVTHYGADRLLEEIGSDVAAKHFNLEEAA